MLLRGILPNLATLIGLLEWLERIRAGKKHHTHLDLKISRLGESALSFFSKREGVYCSVVWTNLQISHYILKV